MRYASYVLGILFLFLLVAFVNRYLLQLNNRIESVAYISQQLSTMPSVFRSDSHPDTSNKSSLPNLKDWANYPNAPKKLLKNSQFREAKKRHQALIRTLTLLIENSSSTKTLSHANKANAIIITIQNDLALLHDTLLKSVKRSITQLILISSIIIITALGLITFPLLSRHRTTLEQTISSNHKLRRQALELRATHTTIGNMLEDILHERKQANRTSEINARLAAIINSADDAIFSLNLAGYITTANLTATKLFGSHIEGKRFLELFPSEVSGKLKSSLMVTEEQNSGSTIDITLQTRKQRVDLSLTISPIRSDEQKLSGFSVIAKDVSNSKLEEERFRLAVEAAPNAMIMINSHGFIVLFNSEAEQMFGYKSDELYGQAIHLLLPESARAAHSDHVQSFINKPSRRQMGKEIKGLQGQRRTGEKFPIEVGLTPIHIDKETYVISSIVDITERIQQQKSLTDLNKELSHKNQEMEQFIYTVSHDLKAPLVTIAGFANRLKQAKDLDLPPPHQHKLDRILANVKSMESLLQDLLHLSRVIKRDLEKSEIETLNTLNKVFSSLEGTIRKSNVKINITPPLEPIFAQESFLFQCLQNIISNAIKYTAAGKQPVINITSTRKNNMTGIRISDNGIGINKQHHNRIFNVFERLNPDVCEGTGVGLSIVKTIMDKHNGTIEIESEEGQGTTFTLLFPDQKTP